MEHGCMRVQSGSGRVNITTSQQQFGVWASFSMIWSVETFLSRETRIFARQSLSTEENCHPLALTSSSPA